MGGTADRKAVDKKINQSQVDTTKTKRLSKGG